MCYGKGGYDRNPSAGGRVLVIYFFIISLVNSLFLIDCILADLLNCISLQQEKDGLHLVSFTSDSTAVTVLRIHYHFPFIFSQMKL